MISEFWVVILVLGLEFNVWNVGEKRLVVGGCL